VNTPSTRGRNWGRIAPALVIFGIASLPPLILFPPMYFIGKHHDDERIFLRNYRAPSDFEAFSSISMSYAAESHEYNDVVFVGDSALRGGLDTREFEQETGLKAYNLGSVWLIGMRAYTLILDAYLKSHPKPRLVVFSMHLAEIGPVPHKRNAHPHAWDADWNEPPEIQDVRDRFLWCFGPGTEDMRPHNSFSYHVRQGLRYEYGLLMGGFEHFADEPIVSNRGETFRTYQGKLLKQRGFGAIPDLRKGPKPIRGKVSTLDPFVVGHEWKKELSTLIRLTADHGVGLLIRFMPFAGEAAEHSPRLRAFAMELESQYPTVVVGRPEVLLYDPGVFVDGWHLDAKGIEKFTTFTASEVKTVLASCVGQGPCQPSSELSAARTLTVH
jgi:hypothetical protein